MTLRELQDLYKANNIGKFTTYQHEDKTYVRIPGVGNQQFGAVFTNQDLSQLDPTYLEDGGALMGVGPGGISWTKSDESFQRARFNDPNAISSLYNTVTAENSRKQEESRVSGLNSFIDRYRNNPNATVEIPSELQPQGGEQYMIYKGNFVQKSRVPEIERTAAMENDPNFVKVPIGSGFGYIPAGSPGAKLQEALKVNPDLTPQQQYDASMKGTPIPGTKPVAPNQTQNTQEEIKNINDEENSSANDALNSVLNEFGDVDTSESSDTVNKILESITGLSDTSQPTKPPSMSELFNSKKASLGIDALEQSLGSIDTSIAQLDADWASMQEGEEGRQVSTREMSRNLSDKQIAYNRQRRDLLVQKDSIANQLSNKYNSLEMVMNFTQSDFTNATNYYNEQFNRNLKLLDLTMSLKDREEGKQDKAKNEAQANLNTIYNLMDSQNIQFSSLTSNQKTAISKLELSAGLPQGMTELISKSAPNQEIKSTTTRTDASGNTYYDVLLSDPKTGALTVKSIFKGTAEPEKATEGDKAKALNSQMYQSLNGKKGTDGYVSPTAWNSLRKGWVAEGGLAKTFDEQFAQFINPTHKADYFTSAGQEEL